MCDVQQSPDVREDSMQPRHEAAEEAIDVDMNDEQTALAHAHSCHEPSKTHEQDDHEAVSYGRKRDTS